MRITAAEQNNRKIAIECASDLELSVGVCLCFELLQYYSGEARTACNCLFFDRVVDFYGFLAWYSCVPRDSGTALVRVAHSELS